jgi:hypothetical protein
VLIGAWIVDLIVLKYAIALVDSTDTEFGTVHQPASFRHRFGQPRSTG